MNQVALDEITALEQQVDGLQKLTREQREEIAALRDLVRLADSYMEDFGQWRDSPAVRRAREEGR